jgi:CelD/BcsL family acetyltransferase involved in cellulose biosynthesis
MRYEILHKFPDVSIESAWRDLLSRIEIPSHYNTPEYFLEPHWTGKKPFAIIAVNDTHQDGRAVAVLTGIHDGDQVVSGLPSRPQIAVDPAADAATALETLLQGLLKESGKSKLLTVYSWPALELSPFAARGFRRRQLQGNVVLDLTQGSEALFQQFSKDRRRNIRYAEKHGITVQMATNRDHFLRAYEVYLAWHDSERKALTGVRRTFENFEAAQLLTGNRRLFLAELEGKVIAINMFRFCQRGLFESAANYSLEQFLHLKPNDLLQWKGIEWACSQGLRRHSLGGAHPFLTRFGGTVVPIIRYRMDRTLLRKHDLREAVARIARTKLGQMSPSVQERVRRALGKKAPSAATRKQESPKSEDGPPQRVSSDSQKPSSKE